ncbi:alpha/beta hydrolase [Actinomyces ruminis]|uniref:alpha/beta hydrolase n=1 Tax=Actinomyces ruminis TaxID=1937003 RepID=UPI00211F1135|nr:alpha/beta hydrolase [Actinomyces ruminis]
MSRRGALGLLAGAGTIATLGACSGTQGDASATGTAASSEAAGVPEGVQEGASAAALPSDLPTYAHETRELTLENNGQLIYGLAYVPNTGQERVPLVICSHGLTGSYQDLGATAEALAQLGLAAYCFDFRGGGGTMSEGEMTDMSVMTEVADLEAVMDAARSWDFVDPERIVLFGASRAVPSRPSPPPVTRIAWPASCCGIRRSPLPTTCTISSPPWTR